jgi:hypothetical protein
MTGVIAVRRARIRRGMPAEGRARGRAGCRWSGSRPQAVIPARGGIEPLARRFVACTVRAGAAAGATARPG